MWEARRRLEVRIQTADGKREAGVIAPTQSHGHVAIDGEHDDARVVQRCVERKQFLAEVDNAKYVEVKLDDRSLGVGYVDVELTKNRDDDGRRDDQNYTQLGCDTIYSAT